MVATDVDTKILAQSRATLSVFLEVIRARKTEGSRRGLDSDESLSSNCATRWMRLAQQYRDLRGANNIQETRTHLVQMMACCSAWIDAIDRDENG